MADLNQQQLALIPHAYEGELVTQRSGDGYVNATAMCKAAGKRWPDYNRLASTQDFLAELAGVVQIPTTGLVQTLAGGIAAQQGTWVHPQVAIHLAQWASPKFAVEVTGWVLDWMTGLDPRDRVWQQYEDRISLVHNNVPVGYWCIFNEISSLFATLITGGATFGTKMILDLSVGGCWGRYWTKHRLSEKYGERATFDHNYPRYFPQAWSNPQRANCYPEDALPAFRRWMREVYMPSQLPAYLQEQVRQGKLVPAIATNAMDALAQNSRARALPQPVA